MTTPIRRTGGKIRVFPGHNLTNNFDLYVAQVPTQMDIGNSADLDRETVGRIMATLSQQGIVEWKGRTLFIREPKGLKDLAMI